MSRVSVYETTHEGGNYGETKLAGWFNYAQAARWSDADYNGDGSGGAGRGEAVMLTAGGKWVLERWTRWQGERDTYEYISDETARDWLLRNGEDAAVREHFAELAEEEDRRPGRPGIGGAVHVRLGELVGRVDAYAAANGLSRAEAVRKLVEAGLR
jgi:hypothetical protein